MKSLKLVNVDRLHIEDAMYIAGKTYTVSPAVAEILEAAKSEEGNAYFAPSEDEAKPSKSVEAKAEKKEEKKEDKVSKESKGSSKTAKV